MIALDSTGDNTPTYSLKSKRQLIQFTINKDGAPYVTFEDVRVDGVGVAIPLARNDGLYGFKIGCLSASSMGYNALDVFVGRDNDLLHIGTTKFIIN